MQASQAPDSETTQPSSLQKGKTPQLPPLVPVLSPALQPGRESGRALRGLLELSSVSWEPGLSLIKLNLQRAGKLPVPRAPHGPTASFQAATGVPGLCLTCSEGVLHLPLLQSLPNM